MTVSRRGLLALPLLMLAARARAQGFAGLGAGAEGFELPRRDAVLQFPRDHGPHPGFRIEWWYLTANLTGPDGTPYGLQWTLFRTALAPLGDLTGWDRPEVWMAHVAVTTPEVHHSAERLGRGALGQAGVVAAPFDAWIDDWRLWGPDFDRLELQAKAEGFGYKARLTATGPLVLQGDRGYSVKSSGGQASHYYSQPHFRIEGQLDLPEGAIPVTGTAWLDREWSSQPLAADQSGWDWFSLSFDDGRRLMGFVLRDASGGDFTQASLAEPDGTVRAHGDGALLAEPLGWAEVGDRRFPVRWRILLAAEDVDVTIEAVNPAAWMAVSIPYWEGPVRIEGSAPGWGYLEMTGRG